MIKSILQWSKKFKVHENVIMSRQLFYEQPSIVRKLSTGLMLVSYLSDYWFNRIKRYMLPTSNY